MTHKYLSIEDYALFRGVTPSTTTSPSLSQVEEYIDLAEDAFESAVGDYTLQSGVESISRARKFKLNGGVMFDGGHLSSISKVEVSDGDDIDPSWTEITNSPIVNYSIADSLTGKVFIRNYILKRQYRVTGTKGYLLADVPKNMKYAVYLFTMQKIFENHLFDGNISDNVTSIVDVDVYREITKGGDPFTGFSALDTIISNHLKTLKGSLRTYIGW